MVSEKKSLELKMKMESLGIKESDIDEKFILGSGKGGQKVQKTSSCVYIKHIPSGIEVKCHKSRSRDLNRFLARRELADKLEQKKLGEKSSIQKQQEKISKQKKRRKKRSQEKVQKKFILSPFEEDDDDDDY